MTDLYNSMAAMVMLTLPIATAIWLASGLALYAIAERRGLIKASRLAGTYLWAVWAGSGPLRLPLLFRDPPV
jgi:hypothetical protein